MLHGQAWPCLGPCCSESKLDSSSVARISGDQNGIELQHTSSHNTFGISSRSFPACFHESSEFRLFLISRYGRSMHPPASQLSPPGGHSEIPSRMNEDIHIPMHASAVSLFVGWRECGTVRARSGARVTRRPPGGRVCRTLFEGHQIQKKIRHFDGGSGLQ